MSALTGLGLLFVALKLLHYIEWSWWAVTAPFYAPFVIFMLFVVCGLAAGKDITIRRTYK